LGNLSRSTQFTVLRQMNRRSLAFREASLSISPN
jgi:hypothetical protein